MKNNATITIRLPQELKDKLNQVAAEYNLTLTEVIISAVRHFLKVYLKNVL